MLFRPELIAQQPMLTSMSEFETEEEMRHTDRQILRRPKHLCRVQSLESHPQNLKVRQQVAAVLAPMVVDHLWNDHDLWQGLPWNPVL